MRQNTHRRSRIGAILGWLGFVLVAAVFAALAGVALSVHVAGAELWLTLAAVTGGISLSLALRRWRSRPAGWAALFVGMAAVGLWYGTLQPRQDRAWAPEVAHLASGSVAGDIVTLDNIRAFDWTSETDAVPKWESRRYDLSQLATVDMFTSVWDSPEIAHLIVSFGFSDGKRVAFSVEIRREADEAYSTLGGFFRQFEIALIAAEESDIVRLRTTLRGEEVSLFPVALDAAQRRALFLSYVDFGNQLNAEPQFYNTVTANCSSTVWRLAKVVKDDVPFDYRLLLSGRLPEMLDALGALPGDMSMADRRAAAAITARAQSMPQGADFSDWTRGGS
ncbi:MAG: hypothetical protein CFE34_03045 [Rhodobacteraceae bacterium PARR1]|nr:MAG: hypothetical protein CFE34_03045 [Rhodobacteraceae bacterium PARR1]